jgi:hypothetical protein
MEKDKIGLWSGVYQMHSSELRPLIGLSEKRLPGPDVGMGPVEVNGVKVWLDPQLGRRGGRGRGGMQHRVRCECPECGKVISCGRYYQHTRVHARRV